MSLKPMKRAIHIDFHTMPGIYNIASGFDAAEFAEILQNANVDYVNFFAQCNIGFSYYDTKIGIKYPGLKTNMTADVIRECHKRNIGVTAYLNMGLNHELLLRSPEFARVDKDGRVIRRDRTANFFRSPCYNTGYGEYLKSIIKEILTMDPDGIFCDCIVCSPCYCNKCTELMLNNGVNLENDADVLNFQYESVRKICSEIREIVPKDKRLYLNGFPFDALKEFESHNELECLPSSGWGYDFFIPQAEYYRNFKQDKVYMTGRFVNDWGDFGGIKDKTSLENDIYDALLMGYGVSVGDHMHPAENIDKNLYKTVGEIYSFVKSLEPWTDGSKPIYDVAVLRNKICSDNFLNRLTKSDRGVSRMLSELKICYNVIDEDMALDSYKLLIIPDEIEITDKLANKLEQYSGNIISSGFSLKKGSVWSFIDDYEMDTNTIGYYKYKSSSVRSMYAQGILMHSKENLISYIKPYFNRVWDGKHGYFYTPPEKGNGYSAVAGKGKVTHICFKIFESYFDNFSKFHKELVKDLIDTYLNEKTLIADELPSTSRATIMKVKNGRLLHIKVTFPEARGEKGIVEEHIVLPAGRNIMIKGDIKKAYTLPYKMQLSVRYEDGYSRLTLPEITGYKAIMLED